MRFLKTALLLAILINMTGCVVGHRSFKTDAGDVPREGQDSIADVKLAYVADDVLLRLSLGRVLIDGYHVKDILPLLENGKQDSSGRFIIKARLMDKGEAYIPDTVISTLNALSFATIPSVWDQTRRLELSLVANDHDMTKTEYHVTERYYSWLPLGLLGPDFFYFLFTGSFESKEQERIKAYERILSRFVADVTPLLLQQH